MPKDNKTTIFSKEIIITNEDGEYIKHTTESIKVFDKEPPFLKLYLADINRLNDLPVGYDNILLNILKLMDYDNIIQITKYSKDRICTMLDIKDQTIRKALADYVKKGILLKMGGGAYVADPHLFAKGKWDKISDLRLVIDYNVDGTRTLNNTKMNDNQLKLFNH